MSLTTILNEIWRFIKDKKMGILVGALIIGVLTILLSLFLPNIMNQSAKETEMLDVGQVIEPISEEEAQASNEALSHIYEQAPASFEFFVQLEDGDPFTNSFVFDEYFVTTEIIEEVENQTGINYNETLTHEKNLNLIKTSQYRGSIAGIRDQSSHVITLRVQAGKDAEENLTLAEAFYDMILDKEVPFSSDLNVTMMREPIIGETLTENNLDMVSSPEVLGAIMPVASDSQSIILYGIAGFIVGLLVTGILLFIIQLFRNKITYAFQYSWDFDDHHFLYTNDTNEEQLVNFFSSPESIKQLVVHQESSLIQEFIRSNQPIESTTALSRFTDEHANPDEIVLLVESNVTEKAWFNEQYRLAEMNKGQITILQITN